MKTISLTQINNFVMACLDELGINEASFMSADLTYSNIQDIIKSTVIPSVRYIHLKAPNILLDGYKLSVNFMPYAGDDDNLDFNFLNIGEETPSQEYTTRLSRISSSNNVIFYSDNIPNDFMRLVSLKMRSWSMPIQTLFNEDSEIFKMQYNKYLRGTYRNPVGVLLRGITKNEQSNQTNQINPPQRGYSLYKQKVIIVLFTSKKGDDSLQYAIYLKEPSIQNNNVEVCDKLESSCLYEITSRVLYIINQSEKAVLFSQEAMKYLDVTMDYLRKNPITGEKIIN